MVARSLSGGRLLDVAESGHMKWLKVITLSALALWLAWDALDGLHFYTAQRDLGRNLERRTAHALEMNDQDTLHICVTQNDSVERAFAVEVLAAVWLAFVAVRLGRAARAVRNR